MPAKSVSKAVLCELALEARVQRLRTTPDIASELGVSLKTVRRALHSLAETGVHVPLVVIDRNGTRRLRWPCATVDNRIVRRAVEAAQRSQPELSLRELARRSDLSDRALSRHLGIVRHSRTRIGQKRCAGQFATRMPSDVAAEIARALGRSPSDFGL
jgi:DNA-binding transcriptional ArsR family regulator